MEMNGIGKRRTSRKSNILVLSSLCSDRIIIKHLFIFLFEPERTFLWFTWFFYVYIIICIFPYFYSGNTTKKTTDTTKFNRNLHSPRVQCDTLIRLVVITDHIPFTIFWIRIRTRLSWQGTGDHYGDERAIVRTKKTSSKWILNHINSRFYLTSLKFCFLRSNNKQLLGAKRIRWHTKCVITFIHLNNICI